LENRSSPLPFRRNRLLRERLQTAHRRLIADRQGVDWIASYDLARDAGARWRILGCRLKRDGRDAT
jgi:hypothetical protein